jgi:hypothetical protein
VERGHKDLTLTARHRSTFFNRSENLNTRSDTFNDWCPNKHCVHWSFSQADDVEIRLE